MRFLQVVTDPGIALDKPKGASQHVLGVRNALRSIGHDVRVLATSPGSSEDGEGVIRIPTGNAQGVERFLAAERWLDELSECDIDRLGEVDIVLERLGLYPGATRGLATRLGAGHVLEVNAPLAEEAARHRGLEDGGIAASREEQAIRAADLVVTVSRALASRAKEIRVDQDRVVHLPNGVDTTRFLAPAPDRSTRRRELGVQDATCVVAFVSTFKPWHGTARLLDAFEAATRRGADLHLLLLGDGPERGAIRARIAGMKDRRSITDLGAVAPEWVPSWLVSADIGAAFYPPSGEHYFSPLKVAEYAAAGLAIARSRHEDMEDLAPELDCSVAVDAADVEGFARALERLASDRALRSSLSRAARRHAHEVLDWRCKMDSLVTRVASLSRRGRG